MVKSLYAIKDNKSVFYDVITCDNEAVMIRDFSNLVKNSGTLYHSNPEDFSLWKIGHYDNTDGSILCLDVPVCVSKAIDFVEVV